MDKGKILQNIKEDGNSINKIKLQMPIKKIGASYYLHLDNSVKKQIEVNEGVILDVTLKNILIIDFQCPKCKHIFSDYEKADVLDCPACGEEFTNTPEVHAELNFKQEVQNG